MNRRPPEPTGNRQMLRKLRYIFEYALVVPLFKYLSGAPFEKAETFLRRSARLWFRIDRRRRRTAIANILRSGIALDPEKAAEIAAASFEHFGVLLLESLRSGGFINSSNWQNRIRTDIPDATMALLQAPGRGVIVASGHVGNWEIAAQTLSLIKPVVGITRPMKNPYVNELIEKIKPRHNFRLTPKHDADAGRFLKTLKDGEILALLIDQYAPRGVMIDFFGKPAWTHSSPALLHLVTGAPLVFGYCVRTGPMQFLMKASEPIVHTPTGNRENDVRTILNKLVGELEAVIRQYPDQYLWAHQRWRD